MREGGADSAGGRQFLERSGSERRVPSRCGFVWFGDIDVFSDGSLEMLSRVEWTVERCAAWG